MNRPLSRHLENIAARMGAFLRGFDDARVHLGTPVTFAREFGTLMQIPALHSPAGEGFISCAEASEYCSIGSRENSSGSAMDPVFVLMDGICGSRMPGQMGSPGVLRPETLRADLAALLRLPRLRFYLGVTDLQAFGSLVERIARREGFSLAGTLSPLTDSCPGCGNPLALDSDTVERCPLCGRAVEMFVTLPLISGVRGLVSYEMLRRVLESNLVETYQEESDIRPLRQGSKDPV